MRRRANPEADGEAFLPRRKRLLFLAAYCLLFFLVMEIVARLLVPPPEPLIEREHEQVIRVLGLPALNQAMIPDADLFWALRPGLRLLVSGRILDRPIDFFVTTNELGLRGRPVPPKGRAVRVLGLGDSCTFGVGVDDERTWPAQLERILDAGDRGGYEVINAGVPGYTAYQGLRYLEARGLALRPDVIVAGFGFNDASSWASRSDLETARRIQLKGWDDRLMASRLYVGLREAALWIRPPRIPEGGFAHPRLSAEEFHDTLLRMHALCAARGIRLILVVWPYRVQAASGPTDLQRYQPLIARAAGEASIPIVNLVPAFNRAGEPLFIDHIHANPEGCRLAAEVIARAVRERGANSVYSSAWSPPRTIRAPR